MSSRSLRRPLSLLAAAAILAAGMFTGPVVSPASAEGSKTAVAHAVLDELLAHLPEVS